MRKRHISPLPWSTVFRCFLPAACGLAISHTAWAEEPNDSIDLATPTGLEAGGAGAVVLQGNTGDGEHVSTGDIDFYSLSANAGQTIRVDVQGRSLGYVLDTVAGLYQSDGTLVASNDDDGQTQDSFINVPAPANDTYYVMIGSFVAGDSLPSDPFTPGTGPGVPGGGVDDYEVIIGIDVPVIITRTGGAFPVVPLSETTSTTLTLQNDGQQPLIVSDLSFEGDAASKFTIHNSLPLPPVPPGANVIINIDYDPSGVAGRVPVTLVIESNDTLNPTLEVPLTGNAYRSGGLIARFSFNEPVGTSVGTFGDVEDLTGNAFLARYFTNAGATVTFARPSLYEGEGTSVKFTAEPNSYVQVSNLVHLPSISLSLWFRPDSLGGGIFTRDPFFGTNDQFYGLDTTGQGTLRWRVNGETVVETEAGSIVPGEIYHAVITHLDEDGFGNPTATLSRLFVNGELIGEVETPPGYDSYENVPSNNNTRLWIGTKAGGAGYGGDIDDFQIYDVALTPEEAISLFQSPGSAARVEDPNLAVVASDIFGTLPPKSGAQETDLALTNTGETLTLEISAVALTGPDSDHFTIGEAPTELLPGATEFLNISFDPEGSDGTFSAQLEFTTNDEGGPTVIVDLTTRVEKESGLLSHYKMDETEGTEMVDASGNRFHGVYQSVNGGSFTLGEPGLAGGTAVRFDDASGAGAGFGELGEDVGLPEFSSLTISMWVKVAPAEVGGVAVLFSKGETVGNPFSVVLGVSADPDPIQWFSNGEEALTTSPVLAIDTAHHIVVSHSDDNGSANGAVSTTLYVDNVMVGEIAPAIGFNDRRASLLQIGAFIGTLGLNGTVDDFQIYSKAVTAEEVGFLFNNPGQPLASGTPIEGDSDGDGLPDAYETDTFGDLTQDGSGDFDNDGQSNLVEYTAGTDAANAQDRFEVKTITRTDTGVVVTFPIGADRVYTLESSTDLTGVAAVPEASFEANGATGTFTWLTADSGELYLQVSASVEE